MNIRKLIREVINESSLENESLLGKKIIDFKQNEAHGAYSKQIFFILSDGSEIGLQDLEYDENIGKHIVSKNTFIFYSREDERTIEQTLNPDELNMEKAIFPNKKELKHFYDLLNKTGSLLFKANFNSVVTQDFKPKERKEINFEKYKDYEFKYHSDVFKLEKINLEEGDHNTIHIKFKTEGRQGGELYAQRINISIYFRYDVVGNLKKPKKSDIHTWHYRSLLDTEPLTDNIPELNPLLKDIIKQLK